MAWIAIVLGVSIGVGLLVGGRLSNLAHIQLQGSWLLFLGGVLTVGAFVVPDDRSWSRNASVALILASYIPLFVVVVLNKSEPGFWLAGLGILLNFIVIAANGGMPVIPEAAQLAGMDEPTASFEVKWVLADEDSRLLFLADVIPIRPLRQVVSVGDFFLALGIGQFLIDRLRRPITWFRKHQMSTPGSAAKT